MKWTLSALPVQGATMGDNKGTENIAKWFLDTEAECMDSMDTLNDLFEGSTDGSDLSNFIDNEDQVDDAVPLALFNQQMTDACNVAVTELKRKYISPDRSVAELSPRLEAVSLSPQRQNQSKRRLFQDSGIVCDEAESAVPVQVAESIIGHNRGKDGGSINLELLNANKRTIVLLSKFKEYYGVSYNELTRQFKSDKTCCGNWVVFALCMGETLIESSKTMLQQYCDYLQVIELHMSALYLLSFKVAKSRETVKNLFNKLFNVTEISLMCDPPRIRSPPAAFFFYQKGLGNSYTFGSTPDWIAKHTLVGHALAGAADTFDLSRMIQWAYDQNLYEDHEIAYRYAQEAETDTNAAAFLNSNCQARYVKECVYMVRLYKRHELKTMSMSQWIQKCCTETEGMGDWKTIACLLRYQNVNVVNFLTTMRTWLKCIPKKQCLLIHGRPDTGKSYFCYSLLRFLRGQVVSFMNRGSQFWLQPLQDSKVGLIDDGTYAFWEYVDVNMRAALDGNKVSLDVKHKAHSQMKLPPLLVTSNINVHAEQGLKYLHSRVISYEFPNKMLLDDDGEPVYKLTDQTWKSFFLKLALQLDLCFEEEDETSRADRAFQCTTRRTAESL